MEKPIIPQPQPLRGSAPKKRLSHWWLTIGLAMLSAGTTMILCANYAQEHLYTNDEVLEIVSGVSRAVGARAFELGKHEKCDRNI